jgi:hypothetical protein
MNTTATVRNGISGLLPTTYGIQAFSSHRGKHVVAIIRQLHKQMLVISCHLCSALVHVVHPLQNIISCVKVLETI